MAEVSDGSTGFSQPGVDLPGDAEPVMQPPIPHLLPVRTEHLLGVVVNWPSVGLTDDFCAPCWSVRRIPTHGRLTPCGN